jgi:hypothetical protein
LNKKIFILIFFFLLYGVSSIQGQYNGGNGGGYDTTAINNTVCTYTLDYTLLFYAGGNGGGYDSSKIDKSTCQFSINTEFLIYAGGNGSGYDTTQISKISCPTSINTEFLIYAGGNGSGYDTTQISKTTCPIPENSNFYLGSPITVGSSKGVISNTTSFSIISLSGMLSMVVPFASKCAGGIYRSASPPLRLRHTGTPSDCGSLHRRSHRAG